MTDAATPETATESPDDELAAAAAAIERLLAPERPKAAAPAAADDRAEETPGPAADAAPDDPAPDEAAADPEEPRYRVKVDGEERELPLSELLSGYQRHADYTRKTMKLAEERRALAEAEAAAAEARAAAEAERALYRSQLEGALPLLRQQMQQFDSLDWAKLAAEDPARFAELAPAHEALAQRLAEAEAGQARLRQETYRQALERREAHRRHLQDEKARLLEKQPALKDPAAYRQEMAALTDYLLDAGYRRDELDRLVDHRDLILVQKAMLYDRMKGARDEVARKLAPLPKLQRPGVAQGTAAGPERRAAMLKRLERTGSTEDAARLIEQLI